MQLGLAAAAAMRMRLQRYGCGFSRVAAARLGVRLQQYDFSCDGGVCGCGCALVWLAGWPAAAVVRQKLRKCSCGCDGVVAAALVWLQLGQE